MAKRFLPRVFMRSVSSKTKREEIISRNSDGVILRKRVISPCAKKTEDKNAFLTTRTRSRPSLFVTPCPFHMTEAMYSFTASGPVATPSSLSPSRRDISAVWVTCPLLLLLYIRVTEKRFPFSVSNTKDNVPRDA